MWMSTEQRPPKFVQVLIPGTRENVALRDKSCSADVIVLSILRCGDYLGLSRWEQCNHNSPHNGKGRRSKSERDVKKLLDVGLADGRRAKTVGSF